MLKGPRLQIVDQALHYPLGLAQDEVVDLGELLMARRKERAAGDHLAPALTASARNLVG